MQTLLSVRLPPDSAAPSLARRAIQDLPVRFHSALSSLQLMVSELVTNGVIHASLLPSDDLELVVQVAGEHLRVEVRDPGRRYEEALAGWTRARKATPPAQLAPEGGYGLFVVSKLAEESGVRWDNGTVVWFDLDLDGVTEREETQQPV